MKRILESTNFNDAFMFAVLKVKSIKMECFENFFADLPLDPYIKGKYRSRRFSRFILSAEKLIKLPHGYFYQSKDYNPLLGDVKREFAELSDRLIALDNFQKLVMAFSNSCKLPPEAEIGVHQIRITCSPNNFGNPAPEGIHRDGVNFIGIFTVARNNIQGGTTNLYTAKKEKPIFSKVLNSGDLLLVNDREFYHFTTPIKPESEKGGFRDVFVLTYPSLL